MDYERILVIILATALAVFLVLGIIVLSLLIKILKNVRHITERAETMSESFIAVGEAIRKTAAAQNAVTGAVVDTVARFVSKRGKGKKKGGDDE